MEEPAECQYSRPTVRTQSKEKPPLKAKTSRFDTLVARYYPVIYSFASRLTDDPSGSGCVDAPRLQEHAKATPESSR